jgi:hypothetical protein
MAEPASRMENLQFVWGRVLPCPLHFFRNTPGPPQRALYVNSLRTLRRFRQDRHLVRQHFGKPPTNPGIFAT